ncbi:hypothetical protein F5148DRAFT_495128 [Russula earlei]|uniref:Uncharacterized protein n=1 Tax=Russula earlei TaxID=71964 RepID=A0ACC0TZJ9_9AGAM|nr:hypothetical protein F5148DRAFT_495128 [Russula earlei]
MGWALAKWLRRSIHKGELTIRITLFHHAHARHNRGSDNRGNGSRGDTDSVEDEWTVDQATTLHSQGVSVSAAATRATLVAKFVDKKLLQLDVSQLPHTVSDTVPTNSGMWATFRNCTPHGAAIPCSLVTLGFVTQPFRTRPRPLAYPHVMSTE